MKPSFLSQSGATVDRATVSQQDRLELPIAKDPVAMVELTQRNQDKVARIFSDLLSNRELSAIVFQDIPMAAGANVTLRHGLKRKVFWSVIDWEGAVLAPASIHKVSATENELTLQSGAAGVAWVKVW